MRKTVREAPKRGLAAVMAAVMSLGACAAFAGERDLASLVPASARVVIQARELGARWDKLTSGPFFRAFEAAPFPQWQARRQEAKQKIAEFEAATQLSVSDLLRTVLGQEVIIALMPKEEEGVFLAKAPSKLQLESALGQIEQLFRDFGAITDEGTERYQGQDISWTTTLPPAQAVAGKDPQTRYRVILDNVLAVSSSVQVLKNVVDLEAGRAKGLASSAEYVESRKALPADCTASVYVDVDTLAGEVDLDSLINGDMKNPVVRYLVQRIKQLAPATRYVALVMTDKGALEIQYDALVDQARVPAAFKGETGGEAKGLKLLSVLPKTTIALFASRTDWAALWDRLYSMADEKARIKLQTAANLLTASTGSQDFKKDVLGSFGPEWAIALLDSAKAPAVAAFLELTDKQRLPNALRMYIGIAGFAAQAQANKKGIEPKFTIANVTHANTIITTATLSDRKDVTPSMAVVGDFLVVTSTLDALKDTIVAQQKATLRVSPDTIHARGAGLSSAFFLNCVAIEKALTTHKEKLVADALKRGKQPEAKIREGIDAAIFLASLLDEINVKTVCQPDKVTRLLTIASRE